MPTQIPSATQAALRRSVGKYSGDLGADLTRETMRRIEDGLRGILNPEQVDRGEGGTVTEGPTPADVRADLKSLLDRFGPEGISDEMNLDFKIDVARKVSTGAGRFVAQQTDVDEYPALELYRLYDRDVPRGFRKEKGTLIEVPDDDWPSRFRDACEAAGDDKALAVLESTGRMIALKSSGVWQELGTNRDDTLGNPFPPFAFNSGYDTDGVPREECVELGLLAEGEEPQPADMNLDNLFAPIEEAA